LPEVPLNRANRGATVHAVTTRTESAREFLVWCADDYTEAFVLCDVLRRIDPLASPEEERTKALSVLTELIEVGFIQVGDMVSTVSGLRYWEGPPSKILARLAAAWPTTAPPEMGHGPWFHATEAGKAAAQ
jgi:hypothetical protein